MTLNCLSNSEYFLKTNVARTLQQQPLGFIDVGARGGAHSLVEPLARMTAVLGFEPDQEEYRHMLSDPKLSQAWADFSLEPIALADKCGEANLHLLSAPTNHSLRAPNQDFTNRYNMEKWRQVGTWSLQTTLLDNVLFENRANENNWGEFIKLDTQGTEYEILCGSHRLLEERTVALVTEVAFCELYKGQKLFSEIELLLREKGFAFYGFYTTHSRSLKQLNKHEHVGIERAMYADAVFFKDPLPGSFYQKSLSKRSLHVLFVCALLLEYYDFALELASKTWAADDAQEREMINRLINQLSHCSPQKTLEDVTHLMRSVQAKPDQANILAGKFVDRRRLYFDYDDVTS